MEVCVDEQLAGVVQPMLVVHSLLEVVELYGYLQEPSAWVALGFLVVVEQFPLQPLEEHQP